MTDPESKENEPENPLDHLDEAEDSYIEKLREPPMAPAEAKFRMEAEAAERKPPIIGIPTHLRQISQKLDAMQKLETHVHPGLAEDMEEIITVLKIFRGAVCDKLDAQAKTQDRILGVLERIREEPTASDTELDPQTYERLDNFDRFTVNATFSNGSFSGRRPSFFERHVTAHSETFESTLMYFRESCADASCENAMITGRRTAAAGLQGQETMLRAFKRTET